ncbi:MAG: O-antigen ligase family protein [bacterium]|nr:O-antigen ligase family protein [bacterium]
MVSRPPAGEAGETLIGFYGFARITGYLILFTYIRENIISREISRIFWLILAVFSFESIVGIAQYLSQNSLGLGLLGEEFLRPGLKGVAEFVSHGIANPLLYSIFPHLRPISDLTINIRAYGTLPHPNVLAGLLFFGLMANIFVLYKGKNRISREILAVFSLITITTGLVVTFSRLAWVISFLGILLFAFIVVGLRAKEQFLMKTGKLDHNTRLYRPERASFIVFILLISAAINLLAFGPQIKDRLVGVDLAGIEANDYSASESIDNRQVFNGIAWEIIKNNPILGVGVRNFVVSMDEYSGGLRPLPHLHQPVHNIYLLIAAESGIFALIVFLFLLYNIVPPVVEPAGSLRGKDPLLRYTLLIIFFGFLFWGLFDHFFWTIQEGSLAFWLVAGLLVARR